MDRWRRRCRNTCIGVLLFALMLRQSGSGASGLRRRTEALLSAPDTAAFLLLLQTGGRAPEQPAPEPPRTLATAPALEQTAPAEEPEPISFAPEDAAGLEIDYGGAFRPDLAALLTAPLELDFSGTEPTVLIIHTHATESYAKSPGWEYEQDSLARTLDPGYNMIRVGDELALMLEAAGISVLHDRGLNDYPSYNHSYTRTLEVIERYLEEYPTIQAVLDIHRDAFEDSDGTLGGTAVEIGGVSTARLMLVVGSDEGVLEHPDWEKNLSFALKLQVLLERDHPGITRPLTLTPNRYNQHATHGSLIVEVGAAGDTLPEALQAVRCFAGAFVKAASTGED